MYIKRVTLKNIGPHRHLVVDFKQGLVGIFGANGKGKSTLVNSIYAGLTNDFSRFSGVKSDIINDMCGDEESFIKIDAEHEGVEFTILRSLRPNKSKLTITGEKEAINKAGDIETRLREELGVDMNIIDHYVFIDQGQIADFLNQTDAVRAKVYKHLCRTEQADDIYKACEEMLKENTIAALVIDNSDELVTAIGELKAELQQLADERKELQAKTLNAKSLATAESIIQKKARYDDLKLELMDLPDRLERAENHLEPLDAKLKAAKKSVASATATINSTKDAAEAAKIAISHLAQHAKRAARKAQLEKSLAEITDNPSEPPAVPEGYDELEAMQEEAPVLSAQIDAATEIVQLVESGKEGKCPTCRQPIDEKFVAEQRSIMQLSTRLTSLRKRIAAAHMYDVAKAKYDRGMASWKASIEASKAELAELKGLKEPKGDKDALQAIIDEYTAAVDALDTARDLVDMRTEEIQTATVRVNTLRTQLVSLQAKLKENEVDESKYAKVKTRLEEHKQAVTQDATLSGQMFQIQRNITDKEESLAKLKNVVKRRKKLKRLMGIVARAREVFHWKELPWIVAQGNLAFMEQDINDALEWFGSPFWAEASEDLSFKIHFPGAPPRKAESLSGGQKGVFAIAFRRGVNTLFGADIGTMWLDEPTANLDDENVSYFEEALNRLAAEVRGNRQMVIITHAKELQSAFDQVITIGESELC